MVGRTYSVQERREQAAGRENVDYTRQRLPLAEAEAVVVTVGCCTNNLGWLAVNRPELLERLMDSVQPTTRLGFAVVVVYNAHVEGIYRAVSASNGMNQMKTLVGLAQRGRDSRAPLARVPLDRVAAARYFASR